MDVQQSCPECGVRIGEPHHRRCDVEPCPYCGRQLTSCSCIGYIPNDDRMPWTGEWPGVAECREYGLYTKWGRGGWEPCGADDPEAVPDLNRLIKEGIWD